jgi:cell wall-associated NlpC family hydrolase
MQRILAVLFALVLIACGAEDPNRLTNGHIPGDGSGDDGLPSDAPVVPVDDTPDQVPLPTSVTPPASTTPTTPTTPAPSTTPTTPAPPTTPTTPPATKPPTTTPPPATPPATATKMETTADLNLRKGPSTSHAVLMVMPAGSTVTVVDAVAQTGFLNVKFNGTTGWASTKYLEPPSTSAPAPSGSVDGAPSPDNAIARAQASVGFSYWWGGGAWLPNGPSASSKGSCSGNCPSCSHAGKYGADCSGMVSKAWQFGVKDLSVNSHAYSTSSYIHDAPGKWSTVSRGALKRGDAMVYNTGSAGHIVLWEKGDGWGASTVYECKGCSYGCVHDTRTFSSSYKGIRRAGF